MIQSGNPIIQYSFAEAYYNNQKNLFFETWKETSKHTSVGERMAFYSDKIQFAIENRVDFALLDLTNFKAQPSIDSLTNFGEKVLTNPSIKHLKRLALIVDKKSPAFAWIALAITERRPNYMVDYFESEQEAQQWLSNDRGVFEIQTFLN